MYPDPSVLLFENYCTHQLPKNCCFIIHIYSILNFSITSYIKNHPNHHQQLSPFYLHYHVFYYYPNADLMPIPPMNRSKVHSVYLNFINSRLSPFFHRYIIYQLCCLIQMISYWFLFKTNLIHD